MYRILRSEGHVAVTLNGLNGTGGDTLSPRLYWATGRGLGNITPRNQQWPEGKDFPKALARIFAGQRVCEFGCGVGRLAKCFFPLNYVGVDICPQAVETAREQNPQYDFHVVDERMILPAADVLFAHTVLLHIPDDELEDIVPLFSHKQIVVSEILGRRWRRDGNPPVFNRDQEDYIDLFGRHGYVWQHTLELPYPHYPGEHLSVLQFERMP